MTPTFKIIKRTAVPHRIPFDDDRAVTDFRAFYEVAKIHVDSVSTSWATEEIKAILDALQERLQNSL